jgi:uroporphyrinogen-III synthase
MPDQMASLVRRHGGVPFGAPVLEEIYLKESPQVQQLVAEVCGGQIDVILLLTGVGTRALIETAASMGRQQEFIDSLDRVKVIARSPKPARVLREHLIHIDLMPPEPFTSEDLVQAMTGLELQGQQIAVQKYGGPNTFLLQSLRERGARVREVTLYTWGLPADRTPALGLIDALIQGKIDSLAFTSQPQIGNLLTIARDAAKEDSLRESLNGSLVVASVGPVCSRRLRDAGIKIDVEPEHPHMGNLVLAVAEHFERQPAKS